MEVKEQFHNLVKMRIVNQRYRFPGTMPVTFLKKHLDTIEKNEYAVSPKADGVRYLLFIDNDGNSYFLKRDITYDDDLMEDLYMELPDLAGTVIDGELLKIGNNYVFLTFDLLFFAGKSWEKENLIVRHKILDNVLKLLKLQTPENLKVVMKEVVYGNTMSASKNMLNRTHKLKYPMDGLIFTPVNRPYRREIARDNGRELPVLKWKPPTENSIDFLMKDCGDNKFKLNTFDVRSRSDQLWGETFLTKKQVDMVNSTKTKVCECIYERGQWVPMKKVEGETSTIGEAKNIMKEIVKSGTNNISPGDKVCGINLRDDRLRFKIARKGKLDNVYGLEEISLVLKSGNKFTCLIYPSVKLLSDNFKKGDIVECKWIPGHFVPHRKREDKEVGNPTYVADETWESISKPVGYDDFGATVQKGLVEDGIQQSLDDSAISESSDEKVSLKKRKKETKDEKKFREFIESIKGGLVNSYARGSKSVLDLAPKHGQNIKIFKKIKIKNVLGITRNFWNYNDIVESLSIQEKQKYKFRVCDLQSEPLRQCVGADDMPRKMWPFDNIVCFDGIHNFFNKEDNLDNILKSINKNLKNGGFFIGIAIDGSYLNKLFSGNLGRKFKNGETIQITSNFLLTRLYKNSTSGSPTYGKEFSILKEGEQYNEYVVNFDELIKKAKKHNLTLEGSENLFEVSTRMNNITLVDEFKTKSKLFRTIILRKGGGSDSNSASKSQSGSLLPASVNNTSVSVRKSNSSSAGLNNLNNNFKNKSPSPVGNTDFNVSLNSNNITTITPGFNKFMTSIVNNDFLGKALQWGGESKGELEIRFGKLKGSSLEGGINSADFYYVLQQMKDEYGEDGFEEFTQYDLSYPADILNADRDIRVTHETLPNGKIGDPIEVITKNTLKLSEFNKKKLAVKTKHKYDFSIAVSVELSEMDPDEWSRVSGKYKSKLIGVRKKKRTSFFTDGVRIDLTETTSGDTVEKANVQNAQRTYEVEVEFLNEAPLDPDEGVTIQAYMHDGVRYVTRMLNNGPFEFPKKVERKQKTKRKEREKFKKKDINFNKIVPIGLGKGGRVPAELRDQREYEKRKQDEWLKIIESVLTSIGGLSALVTAQGYIRDIISKERLGGGVLKGRSIQPILAAITYFSLKSQGVSRSKKQVSTDFGLKRVKDIHESIKIVSKYVEHTDLSKSRVVDIGALVERAVVSIPGLSKFNRRRGIIQDTYERVIKDTKAYCKSATHQEIFGAVLHVFFNTDIIDVIKVFSLNRVNVTTCALNLERNKKDIVVELEKGSGSPKVKNTSGFEMSDYTISSSTIHGGLKVTRYKPSEPGPRVLAKGILDKNHVKWILTSMKDTKNGINKLRKLEKESHVVQRGKRNELDLLVTNIKRLFPGKKMNEVYEELEIFDKINIKKLYNNFVPDEQFYCIRGSMKGENEKLVNKPPKTFKGMECKAVQKTIKETDPSMFETFQNRVQIVVKGAGNKEYDIKLFSNGKFNITGCDSENICSKIALDLMNKINYTKGVISWSERSQFYGKRIPLVKKEFATLTISNMNAHFDTNIVFRTTESNTIGLNSLYNILRDDYSNFMVSETHPGLSGTQRPLYKGAPDTKEGKRIILKLASQKTEEISIDRKGGTAIHPRIITIQLHSNGSVVLSAKSENDIKYAHQFIKKLYIKYYITLHNPAAVKRVLKKDKKNKECAENEYLDYDVHYKPKCFKISVKSGDSPKCPTNRIPDMSKAKPCPDKYPAGPLDNMAGQKCCYKTGPKN